MYCAEFMLRVSHDGNPIIYNNYTEIKYTKHLNNALHQNANITKRARYAIFALSIVDDSCSLQHYFINGTQSKYACSDWSLTRHTDQISWPLLTFISRWKNWPLSRGYFGSWGHALVAVAERVKQESMYGLSAGTKGSSLCKEAGGGGYFLIRG